ncbi:MAG: HlyD family efflux transporter periplasmic adaptor subunit [Roseivirga sp.]|nr:HlyD family efflux transporter periplasmic adaptor subunit [Roseivirga sp.]
MPNNPENIEIRSDQVQDILTKMPHWLVSSGSSLLLVIIGVIIFISWFVKYPDVISTEVMITSQNPPEKLFANSSGQFDTILVDDSDSIKEGQVLAVLENAALYEDVLLLKTILDTVTISKSRFYFPINDLPLLILGDLNNSFASFENNYKEYEAHRVLNPTENESLANHFALSEAKIQLNTLLSSREIDKKRIELKRKDLARQKELFGLGLISPEDYERQEIEHLQSEQTHVNMETSISQKRESIHNLERTIKNSSIQISQNTVKLLRQSLQSFYQLKKALKDWERQYLIKSSIDGQVSFLSFWNKNQRVNTGDLIFTVIPAENKSYIGKIIAPPQNSGKIQAGQRVQIKLANYPAEEYGELNGTVSSISLIQNEDGNYMVNVAIPNSLNTTYNKAITFRHEMKGQADIVTEELRLVERFFYQLRNVFN